MVRQSKKLLRNKSTKRSKLNNVRLGKKGTQKRKPWKKRTMRGGTSEISKPTSSDLFKNPLHKFSLSKGFQLPSIPLPFFKKTDDRPYTQKCMEFLHGKEDGDGLKGYFIRFKSYSIYIERGILTFNNTRIYTSHIQEKISDIKCGEDKYTDNQQYIITFFGLLNTFDKYYTFRTNLQEKRCGISRKKIIGILNENLKTLKTKLKEKHNYVKEADSIDELENKLKEKHNYVKEADSIDELENKLTIETGNNTVYGVSIFPTKMDCFKIKDEAQKTAESIANALDVVYIFYNNNLDNTLDDNTKYYYTCDFSQIFNYINEIEQKVKPSKNYYLTFKKIKKMVVWDFDMTFMRSHWLSNSLSFKDKYPLNKELKERKLNKLYKKIFDKIREKKKGQGLHNYDLENDVSLKRGEMKKLVERLHNNGVVLAIASFGRPQIIEMILEKLKIKYCFVNAKDPNKFNILTQSNYYGLTTKGKSKFIVRELNGDEREEVQKAQVRKEKVEGDPPMAFHLDYDDTKERLAQDGIGYVGKEAMLKLLAKSNGIEYSDIIFFDDTRLNVELAKKKKKINSITVDKEKKGTGFSKANKIELENFIELPSEESDSSSIVSTTIPPLFGRDNPHAPPHTHSPPPQKKTQDSKIIEDAKKFKNGDLWIDEKLTKKEQTDKQNYALKNYGYFLRRNTKYDGFVTIVGNKKNENGYNIKKILGFLNYYCEVSNADVKPFCVSSEFKSFKELIDNVRLEVSSFDLYDG